MLLSNIIELGNFNVEINDPTKCDHLVKSIYQISNSLTILFIWNVTFDI